MRTGRRGGAPFQSVRQTWPPSASSWGRPFFVSGVSAANQRMVRSLSSFWVGLTCFVLTDELEDEFSAMESFSGVFLCLISALICCCISSINLSFCLSFASNSAIRAVGSFIDCACRVGHTFRTFRKVRAGSLRSERGHRWRRRGCRREVGPEMGGKSSKFRPKVYTRSFPRNR